MDVALAAACEREVLREATERGFAIDDVSTETIGGRAGANGRDEPNGRRWSR